MIKYVNIPQITPPQKCDQYLNCRLMKIWLHRRAEDPGPALCAVDSARKIQSGPEFNISFYHVCIIGIQLSEKMNKLSSLLFELLKNRIFFLEELKT